MKINPHRVYVAFVRVTYSVVSPSPIPRRKGAQMLHTLLSAFDYRSHSLNLVESAKQYECIAHVRMYITLCSCMSFNWQEVCEQRKSCYVFRCEVLSYPSFPYLLSVSVTIA